MFESFKNFFNKKDDPVSRAASVRAAATETIQRKLAEDPSLLKDVEQLEQDNPELTNGKEQAA